MALADFAPAQRAKSALAAVLRGLDGWRVARRAARQQHLALQGLLFMPQHRLNDLGIRHDQLVRAMEIYRK
jgi:uncharacterized protein YjiS (DUF1127 family)